eukprot:jgi/Tetstr1/435172/TSEL_002628.t1
MPRQRAATAQAAVAFLLLLCVRTSLAWSWPSWLSPHRAVPGEAAVDEPSNRAAAAGSGGHGGAVTLVEAPGAAAKGSTVGDQVRVELKVSLRQSETTRREAKLAALPYATECSFCHKCHLTQGHRDLVEERHILGGKRKLKAMSHPAVVKGSDAAKAYAKKVDEKAGLPECAECKGCTNLVNRLEGMKQDIKGRHLQPTQGMSRARVYRVSSAHSDLGVAIGKVMCLPFWKDGKLEPCSDEFRSWLDTKLYPLAAAQQRMWVENVTAVMPDTGYVITEPMAMQEIARGGPLKSFHEALSMKLAISTLKKVNSTEVILAALYDLLFSQEDRHADNILIDDDSHLALIDDDKALRIYGGTADSIFLPTTPLYEYQLWGRDWVRSRGLRRAKPHPGEYTLMLDYRCHVEGLPGFSPGSRRLGTKYPAPVRQCLAKLASMTDVQVMEEYGFPTQSLAKTLQQRAADLHTRGFEWTLHQGKPARSFCKSFPWRPPCCAWEVDTRLGHEVCADKSWRPERWQKTNCRIGKDGIAHNELPRPDDWDPLKGLKTR